MRAAFAVSPYTTPGVAAPGALPRGPERERPAIVGLSKSHERPACAARNSAVRPVAVPVRLRGPGTSWDYQDRDDKQP
jgi:hypothetical protein